MASKFIYIIKYLLFAFIFLFFIVLQNSLALANIGDNLIPNIAAFLIFYSFFIRKSISYFGVFLLCVIYDVMEMLPTGITAMSVLITCKLLEIMLSKTTLELEKHAYVIFLIYFLIYNVLELFLMTYLYDRYFIPSLTYIFINFIYIMVFRQIVEFVHSLIERED